MSDKTAPFRWIYIILPVAVLIISVILAAVFYHLLPGEAAYHFEDGSPDKWVGRGAIIAWMLAPQLVFVLLAGAIVWLITKLSAFSRQAENPWMRRLLSLMGNMVALPQLILSFAMLDIFIYNSCKVHIMPLWVFALIVMVSGGIILGIFFIRAIRQVWGSPGATPGRNSKE